MSKISQITASGASFEGAVRAGMRAGRIAAGIFSGLLAILLALAPVFALAEPATHVYTVSLDDSLETMHVRARYAHPVERITARSSRAGRFLDDASLCESEKPVSARERRLLLPQGGVDCIVYRVDIASASSHGRTGRRLARQNVLTSPSYWLWRPALDEDSRIIVDFQLPAGLNVSVPWQKLDASGLRYELRKSPESAYAPAIFGEFDYREVRVPGAVLRVSLLETGVAADNEALFDWVRAAATDVSLAYGHFPNPSPQVVVVPVTGSRSSSPVPFGRVIRDGGETVELYVDPARPLGEILGDWTATHEFSHLMVPYLHRDARWVSEGLAQYYQNVLLTRAGAYDEETGWRNILAGLERGRQSRPDLSPNEAASGRASDARMKVYWSGAALALRADVRLRERSGGRESLDTVLARFAVCCLPSSDTWTAPEFLAKLDELAGDPVFVPLYRQIADTPGFPDTRPTLEKLGILTVGDAVRLRDGTVLDDVRRAIMAPDTETARWRAGLAAE